MRAGVALGGRAAGGAPSDVDGGAGDAELDGDAPVRAAARAGDEG